MPASSLVWQPVRSAVAEEVHGAPMKVVAPVQRAVGKAVPTPQITGHGSIAVPASTTAPSKATIAT